jgi:uncharacterized membrane protein
MLEQQKSRMEERAGRLERIREEFLSEIKRSESTLTDLMKVTTAPSPSGGGSGASGGASGGGGDKPS